MFCLREDSHMAGRNMKEVTVYTTVFNLLVYVLLVLWLYITYIKEQIMDHLRKN